MASAYQYDGSKGTTLEPVTWNSREYRYEFAAFRFLTGQTRVGDTLAEPSWVFEVSRRWRLHWDFIDYLSALALLTKSTRMNDCFMNPHEQAILENFLDQLVRVRGTRKIPEADAMIRRAVDRQPDAAYLLVQRSLVLGQALEETKARLAEYELGQGQGCYRKM